MIPPETEGPPVCAWRCDGTTVTAAMADDWRAQSWRASYERFLMQDGAPDGTAR